MSANIHETTLFSFGPVDWGFSSHYPALVKLDDRLINEKLSEHTYKVRVRDVTENLYCKVVIHLSGGSSDPVCVLPHSGSDLQIKTL
jgi:hypothetical protein